MWKIVVLKVLWVLDNYQLKKRTQAVLGKDAYLRIIQQAKTEPEPTEQFSKVINGEIVGKALPPGDGVQEVDPAQCEHPTTCMKRRGNKKNAWWTCNQCLSRWERKSLDSQASRSEIPRGTDLVTFGRHVGKTFAHVYNELPQYGQWVLSTVETEESCDQLRRLAAYLQRRERHHSAGLTHSDPEPEWETEHDVDMP
jgi:hypothetical protein